MGFGLKPSATLLEKKMARREGEQAQLASKPPTLRFEAC